MTELLAKRNKTNTVFKLWVPIGISILIPLLLVNIATAYLLKVIKNEDYITNLEKMNQAQSLFERLVDEANTTIRLVSSDKKIISLGLATEKQTEAAYIKIAKADTICKQLLFYDTGGFITSFYFSNSDTILSSGGTCDNVEKFYHTLYRYGDLELNELRTLAMPGQDLSTIIPMNESIINGFTDDGIIILRRLPEIQGTLASTILKKERLDSILDMVVQENGFGYITDESGNLLYSAGKGEIKQLSLPEGLSAKYIESHPYQKTDLVTHSKTTSGFNIVSVNPRNDIYKNTVRLQFLVWIMNIVCISIALTISFIIIARRISRLKNVMGLIAPKHQADKNSKTNNFYAQIDDVVLSLKDKNTQLTDQVQTQQQKLSSAFWDSVFMGNFNESESFLTAASQSGIATSFPYYCLFIVTFNLADFSSTDEIERIYNNSSALFRKMSDESSLTSHIHKVGATQIVVTLSMESIEKVTYRQMVCDFLSKYGDFYIASEVCVIASGVFDKLSETYYHYSLCKALINNISVLKTNEGIIWCDDTGSKLANEFYFPTELENRITSGIVAGDFSIVKEGFRLVILNNFENKNISPTMVTIVRSKLRIIIATAYNENMDFELKDVFAEIPRITADIALVSYVLDICKKMCLFYQEYNKKTTVDMKQKIIEYINAEFTNPSMSLSMISSHFSFSDAHFSRMLKELLGENFSSYLERIRMEYADKLVVETDMKVEDISAKVSYDNVDSFRRAYKRYIGMPPSERRQNAKH